MKAKNETEDFLKRLCDDNGYLHIKEIPGNRYACIYPMLFTHAIIISNIGDIFGYNDRWCYHSMLTHGAAKESRKDGIKTHEPEGVGTRMAMNMLMIRGRFRK